MPKRAPATQSGPKRKSNHSLRASDPENVNLPLNAVRHIPPIRHIYTSLRPVSATDVGLAELDDPRAPVLHLCTWGANHTREEVETYRTRRFVFTGWVYDHGQRRENYEELL